LGGSQTISTSETRIEALRLQSSTYGATIAAMFGVTRVPGNMLWTGGFRAIPTTTTQRSGKGGSVRVRNTTYSYVAHVAMALGEGPIIGIRRVWRGKKQYSGGFLGSEILTATHSYTVPGGGGSVTVTNAASWTNTVVVFYTAPIAPGDGSSSGPAYLAEGVDYTVAGGTYTFPAAQAGRALSIQYQYVPSGFEAGLAELGMTKFPGQVGQATWSLLAGSFAAEAVPYSGLAYVAAQDYDLGGDAAVENHNFEVQAALAYHLGAAVADVDPALVAFHCLTHQRFGALLPSSRVNFGLWSTYCRAAGLLISPAMTEQTTAIELLDALGKITNTAPVWSGGRLRMMPFGDSPLNGFGATYTPNVTPVYDLDETCFLPRSGGGEPIEQIPRPKADRYNHVRIEFVDRANDYNVAIAETKDQADIDTAGLRTAPVVKAHSITTANVAQVAGQLLLQRYLYVPADYRFSLPATFALLEPMDLVRLRSTGPLGLTDVVVRIRSIEEETDGDLNIVAEEFAAGIATASLYLPQAGLGYNPNFNAAPGNVLPPTIFEAPAERTTTGLEVYAAVGGIGPNWGGCTVWVSLDGAAFVAAGTVVGGTKYGRLTGPIAGGNLPVVLNSGQLVSASATDAAALSSLCYIGGSSPEYLAYQGATLTGSFAYTLAGLVRGQFGTDGAAPHATNDPFVRVDEAIGRSGPLDLGLIGRTITFKFTSFNLYGSAEQDLADVTGYTYTITGRFANRASGIDFAFRTTGTAVATRTGFFKSGGVSAWDASLHSLQGYRGGAFVSFRPTSTGRNVMVGLNTDPAADAGSASIDYAIYCSSSGNLEIYESGSLRGIIGPYSVGDDLAVVYDGARVRYLQNGIVLREVITGNDVLVLYLDSSVFEPGTEVTNLLFGPFSAFIPEPFIARGNCQVTATNCFKNGGATAWDSDVLSARGYSNCFLTFKPSQTNCGIVAGLNSDPQTDANFPSIDFAFNTNEIGLLYIFESGSLVQSLGTYDAATVLAITYDGGSVRYYVNGVLVRTTVAGAVTLFFDSSFLTPGGGLDSLRFGPGQNVPVVDTPQIGLNAATDVVIVNVPTVSPGVIAAPLAIASVSPKATAHEVLITAVCDVWRNSPSGAASVYICRLSGGVPFGTVSQPVPIPASVTSSPGMRIALQFEYDAPAGVAQQYALYYEANTLGTTPEGRNIALHVELVKR
jgi:hypothetical protein